MNIRALNGLRLLAFIVALAALAATGRAVRLAEAQTGAAGRQPQIPEGPQGDQIRLGQQIFAHTPRYAAKYVGNQMKCSDCHLRGGRAPYSSPLVGVPALFPSYNKRAGRVITFTERIQECFVRSENGKPPDPQGPEMKALLGYIDWLSLGQPKGKPYPGRGLIKLPRLKGDAQRGAAIYASQCSVCHGEEGAGTPPVLPPLWGPDSFNDGAGMSRVEKMAAFVKHNMPQSAPGSLTAQQAYDVAAYVNSKPRPKMNPAYGKY